MRTFPAQCGLDAVADQATRLVDSDCSSLANSNSGCTVVDKSTASYGAPFAAAGGGVFATELAETGISIWFFTVRESAGPLL